MNTSQSKSRPLILETRFVWGETVPDCMERAQSMRMRGWMIQGNPAPMMWNGKHGTGVSVTRVSTDD